MIYLKTIVKPYITFINCGINEMYILLDSIEYLDIFANRASAFLIRFESSSSKSRKNVGMLST